MSAVDYMSRAEEQAKQPAALALCQRIAAAYPEEAMRPFVFSAAWSFWNFAHAWDDLMDEGNTQGPKDPKTQEKRELAWKALYTFVDDLLLNPFLRANAHQVRSLLCNAIGKGLEAEDGSRRTEGGPEFQQGVTAVLRCADVDVLRGFAELAGGWELMRELGPLWDYDVAERPNEERQAS